MGNDKEVEGPGSRPVDFPRSEDEEKGKQKRERCVWEVGNWTMCCMFCVLYVLCVIRSACRVVSTARFRKPCPPVLCVG